MFYSLIIALPGVFTASVLRGFTGFSFGLASASLLSPPLPPAQVVPLVVVLQILVGILRLKEATRLCEWHAVCLSVPGPVLTILGIFLIGRALPG